MRQAVENDPNGIGFLSNYQADKGGLNSVELNGVACNKTTAASGQYAGVAVSSRSPRARPPAPRRRSSTGSNGRRSQKIIASQWIPIG